MTIDQGSRMERYQGIVALDGGTLEDVAHAYFQQSEQIPTLVRLAVAEHSVRGQGGPHWRAGGALVQFLPPHGVSNMPDLPGDGDFSNPRRPIRISSKTTSGRRRARCSRPSATTSSPTPTSAPSACCSGCSTSRASACSSRSPSRSACTCSAERIESMLRDNFTAEERGRHGGRRRDRVVCEFCSTDYHFHPHEFDDTEHPHTH